MTDLHDDRILILDFGSQYTQLIARRVREAGVYCEIYPWDAEVAHIEAFGARGFILSGGPESTLDSEKPEVPAALFDLGVPILGICYGMQAIAQQLGGKVENVGKSEFGYASVRARGHTELLRDIQDQETSEGYGMLDVWMSHGDRVAELPPGFKLMASTESAPIAGMADANIIDATIADVRARVGQDEVVLGLSGGVDSSVVAALLHKAIGEQLTCIFVDTGLLRYREGDQVMEQFAEHMGVQVIRIDAEARFLAKLEGLTDPEDKRKAIGNLFIDIFEEEAGKLANAKWLAQGTIYPDVIESAGAATGKAHLIKSHHNVGGLPEEMKLDLVEPLRELFKDEVRQIGVELGIPRDMVYRHPFPGPGLGVRILGEVKKEFADTLRLADHIFIEELHNHDLYDKVSQAFVVFLPVKSVGVTGDGRRYNHVVSLRAVETIDFMTARWADLPYHFLDHVSRRTISRASRREPSSGSRSAGDHRQRIRNAKLSQTEAPIACQHLCYFFVPASRRNAAEILRADDPGSRHRAGIVACSPVAARPLWQIIPGRA
jgi:GMP synthase (glutamine-hydrolysing)